MLQAEIPTVTSKPAPAARSFIHLAYWIIVAIIFLYDRSYLIVKAGMPYFLACSVVRIALLVAIAYANIYWLIPHYLLARKYFTYFGMVLLLLIVYLLLQSLYDYLLFGFVLGPSRNASLSVSLLYNFTHTSWYLLLTIAVKLSIDWYQQKEIMQQTAIGKLQAEVNYLRAQVNPHFLFNVLNNLYALTLRKSDLAPEVVLKLSGMMEYMLYESNEPLVPLEKEITYIENYLELEKLRQGNNANINIAINGSPAGHNIAPFLLLPLLENAFKHGINKLLQDAYLDIHINIDATSFSFRIDNNKPRIAAPAEHGGIGLSNLEKRLELLYPGRYSLQVSNQESTYQALLKITF
ncbi:MAG: histidine kinase [Chitinophagaceae bacterium]